MTATLAFLLIICIAGIFGVGISAIFFERRNSKKIVSKLLKMGERIDTPVEGRKSLKSQRETLLRPPGDSNDTPENNFSTQTPVLAGEKR